MKVLTLRENVMCMKRQCLSYLSCLVPLRRVYSETMTLPQASHIVITQTDMTSCILIMYHSHGTNNSIGCIGT